VGADAGAEGAVAAQTKHKSEAARARSSSLM
jgi:hypothetical protein